MRLSLKVERRWWFDAAFKALNVACALTSFISLRAADALSESGTTLLARYGIKLTTGEE